MLYGRVLVFAEMPISPEAMFDAAHVTQEEAPTPVDPSSTR